MSEVTARVYYFEFTVLLPELNQPISAVRPRRGACYPYCEIPADLTGFRLAGPTANRKALVITNQVKACEDCGSLLGVSD